MEARAEILRVLVTRSEQIPGTWVAHCLDLDVVTQGEGIRGAMDMLVEAVMMVVEDDLKAGLDPFERPDAPEECWEQYSRIMRHGRPLDSVPSDKRDQVSVVVAQLHLLVRRQTQSVPVAPELSTLPEPWQIAEFERMQNGPDSNPHC